MGIRVTVAMSPAAREVLEQELTLDEGSSVADALQASGWVSQFPELAEAAAGIWGRKAARTRLLREGDRVEFYRPLKVDPKLARRERFVKQGARAAGLFARKRPGAKAGY